MPRPRAHRLLRRLLRSTARAIDEGVPLEGYIVWSLIDNFEWAAGYGLRFGIVYVDYATQERLPKSSAMWLRQVISANALPALPVTAGDATLVERSA